MWNRIKKLYKKKHKRDQNIEKNAQDEFVLRDVTPHKIEPEEVPSNMKIHAKYLGPAKNGKHLFSVNEIVIDAEDILEAQRKYLRIKSKV